MLMTVADRFGFSDAELFSMKMTRLSFWYDAAVELIEQDEKQWRDAGRGKT